MDYYEALDLDQSATATEIKTSFRNKLKILHPDTHRIRNFRDAELMDNSSPEFVGRRLELLQVIQAYEVLSSPIKRRIYDEGRQTMPSFLKRKKRYFDYEKFLLNRQHIFKYKAKLFLYELVFKSGKGAMQIYESILKQKMKVLLKVELGRLDYMDSLFLLSELYQESSDLKKIALAIDIHLELFHLESARPYFKEFMSEIIENIFTILETHHAILLNKETRLLLKEIQNFEFSKEIKGRVEGFLTHSEHTREKTRSLFL